MSTTKPSVLHLRVTVCTDNHKEGYERPSGGGMRGALTVCIRVACEHPPRHFCETSAQAWTPLCKPW